LRERTGNGRRRRRRRRKERERLKKMIGETNCLR
jgi:hypothetical protein